MLKRLIRSVCFATAAICSVCNTAMGTDNKNGEITLPDFTIHIGSSRPYVGLKFYRDEENKLRPCNCWSDTGKRATLEEALERDGLKGVELPTTPEEFAKYRDKYYAQSEDELLDDVDNDFWAPINKINLELEFFCMERRDPSVLFPKIRTFCDLLAACEDEKFKSFLFDMFFDFTGIVSAHMVLASCPHRCDSTKEDLFIDLLTNEFNSILDSIDPRGKYIRWRFSSEYE